MTIRENYPNLHYLIASSFHQDWSQEAKNFEGVVALIKEDLTPDRIERGFNELQRAISDWRNEPEEKLAQNIERGLSCHYNYAYFGLTGIEFLEKLRDHLKA